MDVNVSLSEDLARFVEAQIGAGRYASAGELVIEAVRLLERQGEEPHLDTLRRARREGIESGEAREVDFAELKRERRDEAGARPRDA